MAHFLFWPFDIGTSKIDRERARAKTHIADVVRMGVLAQEEGAELRIAGHLMGCEFCKESSISLWEHAREKSDRGPTGRRYSCVQTRNALFRLLEEGRPFPDAALAHLRECPNCGDHFLEPGKAQHTLAVDEQAAAAQD